MEITFPRGRLAGPIVIFGIAAAFLLAAAFMGGLIQTLGYEKKHVTYSGFASGTSTGSGFGLKDMVFFEGQTFFVEYDADITKGALHIGILETFGPFETKPYYAEDVTASGTGEVTYRIPKTGLYTVFIDGTVARGQRGYDIAYSARWGAR